VTDIKALAIRIAESPRVVYTDEITGAQTTHYTLEIDLPSKAVSFENADKARQRKTGAFMRHKKSGYFVLAIESGRHTDPATGNSLSHLCAMETGSATRQLHSRRRAKRKIQGRRARAKPATGGQRNTRPCQRLKRSQSHIIGGAIIPLWQRFKTQEDTRLRVVRVTTEDSERIVGIQIPRDRVGAVLRSAGDSRDLREPDEIFNAVLNEAKKSRSFQISNCAKD